MVKVYEWKMVPVQEMHAASVDGWERDSGPVLDALHFACLMRREVVPGRVAPEPSPEFEAVLRKLREQGGLPPFSTGGPVTDGAVLVVDGFSRLTTASMAALREAVREHASGTEDGLGEQSDPLRNCLTCRHLSFWADGGERCDSPRDGEPDMAAWVERTHVMVPGRLGVCCPPTADGCPGWAPKATP